MTWQRCHWCRYDTTDVTMMQLMSPNDALVVTKYIVSLMSPTDATYFTWWCYCWCRATWWCHTMTSLMWRDDVDDSGDDCSVQRGEVCRLLTITTSYYNYILGQYCDGGIPPIALMLAPGSCNPDPPGTCTGTETPGEIRPANTKIYDVKDRIIRLDSWEI